MPQEHCYLTKDGSKTLVLVKGGDQNLDQEVILKADFPTERDKPDLIIYSPTLRLNADLASFTKEELEKIALCEKFRAESVSIRSYQKTFEPTVGLLSSNQDFIDRLLSTYGGVLNLLPIKVPKRTGPSLSLSKDKKLIIEYQLPLPLDPFLCSMCRRCACLCREDAINSSPSIDLELCSFCKDCVDTCPEGAIDLHRMERIREEVDLVIKDPSFSLPVTSAFEQYIFTTDTLSELFSKIGTFHVEEAVIHNVEYCGFVPRLGLGCKRCLSVCPEMAIKAGEKGISIDQARCIECGRCVSVCPTGAMTFERFNDALFFGYFNRLDPAPGLSIVIGNQESLKEYWWKAGDKRYERIFFLEHPQPASLGAVHFLFLFTLGFRRIAILTDDASVRKGPVGNQAAFANDVLTDLSMCKEAPVRFFLDTELEEFLARGSSGGGVKVPMLVSDLSELASDGRRKALNSVLWALFKEFQKKNGKSSAEISSDDFATANIGDTCSLCLACLNVCNQEALQAKETEYLQLLFNRSLCINCGACEKICPEKALYFIPGLVLSDDFHSFHLLARDELVKCERCGKVFGNKKSFERTMKILKDCGRYSEKELKVLSMCEECRAITMLEDAFGE